MKIYQVLQVQTVRRRIRILTEKTRYHYTIIGLVIFDLLVVFIDLVISILTLSCYSENQLDVFEESGLYDVPEPTTCLLHESSALVDGEWFLWAISVFLLSLFTTELLVTLFGWGLQRLKKPIFTVDLVIVVVSLFLEIFFRFSPNHNTSASPAALVFLRLWKIIRAIHAVAHSVEMKNQSIIRQLMAAKQEIEEEHRATDLRARRAEYKISYLREHASDVSSELLEDYVNWKLSCETDQKVISSVSERVLPATITIAAKPSRVVVGYG